MRNFLTLFLRLFAITALLIALPGGAGVRPGQALAASPAAEPQAPAGATPATQLITLQPDHSQYATAGSGVFYRHTLTNGGQTTDDFTVSAVSSRGWTTRLWQDTQTGTGAYTNPLQNPVHLAPGATAYLAVEVVVPAGTAAGTTDQTVATARSGNDSRNFDTATDTTVVFVNDPPVVDGKYDDAYRISPNATEVCYLSNGQLFGKLASFYQPTGSAVYMVLAIDKGFVDNTYGTNIVGWTRSHNFSDLVGSDHAQFLGYNANGTLVLDIKQDYISSASGTPSGYDSLGVTGGEGRVNTGSAAHILQWATSEDYNLNNTGYCSGGNCAGGGTDLKVNSPATDSAYTPNPTYPNWIYDVIYELKIDKAAFGSAGFGRIEVPYIHASPSKAGTNTIYAEPGTCPGEIGDFVWYDTNHDGVQDPGEAGINGVQVKLYRDNGDGLFNTTTDTLVGTQTTSGGGKYLFQNLSPASYFVDVVDSTVPAGYILTTANDPTPIINLAAGQRYLQADFGYVQAYPDLEVAKTLTSPAPVYAGQQISFTIRITNTGLTTINILPLRDWYDTSTLDYLGATPASDDNVDDGAINWADLTTSLGRDLLPGESFAVVTRFLAVTATQVVASAAAAGLAPDAEPVVDGRVESNYTFVSRAMTSDNSSGGALYSYTGSSACYYAFVMDRRYNSNVYADPDTAYLAQDGWLRSHKFSDLLNSDNAVFDITYSGGKLNDLTLDLLYGTAGNWSSGQTGKDGSANPGTAPIQAAMTSLEWNLENSGWTNLTHSPAYNYTPWEWNLIYEFSIPKSAMNGACGTATVVSAHNSPSKYSSGTGSIGDCVWGDVDRDGVKNNGEVGLPGVTVNLYQGSTLVRTTRTESGPSCYYIFGNLDAGTYVVNVDETTLPANYTLTTNNEPKTVTIAAGGSNLTADFGYWLSGTASIGDRVFYDLNGDGLPDNDGDPGLNGVTVRLYEGASCTGALKATAVTAGNGAYSFTRLPAGTYCVDVDESTLPAGYALTTANEPQTVNLADGQAYTDADFGYRVQCVDGTANLALVSGAADSFGTIVADRRDFACVEIKPGAKLELSKVLTSAEPAYVGQEISFAIRITNTGYTTIASLPLQDWYDPTTLEFLGATPMPNAMGSGTLTWADLTISLGDLAPGQAITVVTRFQAKSVATLAAAGAALTLEAAGAASAPDLVSPSWNIEVWPSASCSGWQILFQRAYGTASENWRAKVDGTIIASGTTYGNNETVTGTWSASLDLTTSHTFLAEIYEGNSWLGRSVTFGNCPIPATASIGDRVFNDLNGSGLPDGGTEPGINGVTVQLFSNTCTGTPLKTATTAGNGAYSFTSLVAGTYCVHVNPSTVPAGYQLTTGNLPLTVSLATGQSYTTADFGYRQMNTASIGDRVFYDLDGSGLPDGGTEPGVNGISVRLFSNTCTGTPLATATTAGNGAYSFTSLVAGTYCVHVDPTTVPTGYQLTTGNLPLTVSLATGQSYTTADFGYRVQCPHGTPNLALVSGARDSAGVLLPDRQSYACAVIQAGAASIGDYVWNDANGDGLQNEGTGYGINGVILALYRDDGDGAFEPGAGDTLVLTRTTAVDGGYQFTNVVPGAYWVDVPAENPFLTGYTFIPGTQSGPDPKLVTVGANDNYTTADFGYAGKGLISGVVFYDWNRDGTQDLNEGPITTGVEVCLYKDNNRDGLLDGGDTKLTCMTTGDGGTYAFAGQVAGAYLVIQTQPAGLQTTTPNLLPVTLVVVGSSGSAPDNNFGEIIYMRLGDMVYVDINGNGSQEPGETIGLTGVQLQLTGTNIRGDSVNWTTVTMGNGHYLTDTLLPGTYTVKAPPQYGGFQLTSPAAQTTTLTIVITEDLTLDFGYVFPTGVGVLEFKAAVGRGQVTLSWLAFGEQPPSFHVRRADNSKGVGAVPVTAQPVTSGTGAYQFVDRGVVAGQTYWYTLEDANTGQTYGPLAVTVAPMSIRAFLPMLGQ